MSGALARVLGTVSAIGSALTLLTGGSIVTLDDFAFQDFEVPERVRWGGAQQLAVHRFPGGARQIDAMGPDEADITWAGILGITQDPTGRALQLDAIRQAGQPVPLIWGEFSRTVVVKSCEFDQAYGQTRYQITVTVQPDDTGTGGVAPSPLAQVQQDINTALGFDLTGTLATAATALQGVQAVAAPLVGAIAPSTASALLTGFSGVTGALSAATSAADLAISGAASATQVVGSLQGFGAVLEANRVSAVGNVAAGYVGRAAVNT